MARSILLLLLAYLIGSIPGSVLVARLAGSDLRTLGDGNPGAHNVMRHVGRGWGMLALVLDAGKGALAVLIAQQWSDLIWVPVVAGWLAIAGHNYSIWLRGRGGKGLATGLGVMLALFPDLIWFTIANSIILIALTRNLAFSGVVVALLLSFAAWWRSDPIVYVLAPLGVLLLMAIKQFPDLRRMWRAAPDKRDLILNRWIRDREAKL